MTSPQYMSGKRSTVKLLHIIYFPSWRSSSSLPTPGYSLLQYTPFPFPSLPDRRVSPSLSLSLSPDHGCFSFTLSLHRRFTFPQLSLVPPYLLSNPPTTTTTTHLLHTPIAHHTLQLTISRYNTHLSSTQCSSLHTTTHHVSSQLP